MRFVRLTRWDGQPLWLNPAQVLWVEPHARDADGKPESTQSKLVFGMLAPDTGCPFSEVVTECPREVAALFLEPAGP